MSKCQVCCIIIVFEVRIREVFILVKWYYIFHFIRLGKPSDVEKVLRCVGRINKDDDVNRGKWVEEVCL